MAVFLDTFKFSELTHALEKATNSNDAASRQRV